MKRVELEHIIRAVAALTKQSEFVIVGSQSILGAYPEAPAILCESVVVDIYPLRYDPSLSDLIDGSIGEESPSEQFLGYYPKGVSPDSAVRPSGWQERLIEIRNADTNWKCGYCLEPHDLAIAKLVAAREKDKAFVQEMLVCGMTKKKTLLAYLDVLAVGVEVKKRIMVWIASTVTSAYPGKYRP